MQDEAGCLVTQVAYHCNESHFKGHTHIILTRLASVLLSILAPFRDSQGFTKLSTHGLTTALHSPAYRVAVSDSIQPTELLLVTLYSLQQ